MRTIHETQLITKRLHTGTMHDIIQYTLHENHMLAQKRLVRVTLDIMCYDDLNVEDMKWKELLDLQSDEDVHVTIKDYDDLFQCDSMRTACGKKVFHNYLQFSTGFSTDLWKTQ